MVMIIISKTNPKNGKMIAISENNKVSKPNRKLERRNHLGKPKFISPKTM